MAEHDTIEILGVPEELFNSLFSVLAISNFVLTDKLNHICVDILNLAIHNGMTKEQTEEVLRLVIQEIEKTGNKIEEEHPCLKNLKSGFKN